MTFAIGRLIRDQFQGVLIGSITQVVPLFDHVIISERISDNLHEGIK